MGTITLDVSARTGPLVAAKEVLDSDELMVITAAGQAIRVSGSDIPTQGRATQGKRVIEIAAGDRVVEVTRVAREGESSRSSRGDDDESEEQLELMRSPR